ncbi:MAG: hypothetical protein PUG16_07650 [Lachnospiraceae bacterium]|nr:hypothetical protein [Lachnospiraceae bacterium]
MQKADIVIAGPVGLAGTRKLLSLNRDFLAENFPAAFLNRAEQVLSIEETDRLAEAVRGFLKETAGLVYISEGGPGGIEADLWRAGEALKSGLSADLQQIPIRQETVEIAEFLNENPYQLDSKGSWLILAENGRHVANYFKARGFRAATVGELKKEKGRVFHFDHGRETRFLEKP